jgi:hypothetical protein
MDHRPTMRVGPNMPRYYFHIHNGLGVTRDEEGVERDHLEAARAEALAGIRSILKDQVGMGQLDLAGSIEIEDAAGRLLLSIPFRDALHTVGGDRSSD